MVSVLSALALLTGCEINLLSGGKFGAARGQGQCVTKQPIVTPTLGQQLLDLQKARAAGVITDAEYEAQKAKLLKGG
jgi:hypothetical protein